MRKGKAAATSHEDPINSPDQWKRKYYTSLERFESKETEWATIDALLRRSISRLTLAADGISGSLDEQLERLRNTIRDERDGNRIKNMIDGILDSASSHNEGQKSSYLQRIFEQLIDDIPFPDSVCKEIKQYKKLLHQKNTDDTDLYAREFCDLVSKSISQNNRKVHRVDDVKPARNGFLGRLFSTAASEQKGSENPEFSRSEPKQVPGPGLDDNAWAEDTRITLLELINKLHVPGLNQSQVAGIKEKILLLESHDDLKKVFNEIVSVVIQAAPAKDEHPQQTTGQPAIHEILIQLLDRLDLTEGACIRAKTLKARWENGIPLHQLPAALESIAALIAEMRAEMERDKHDTELFLKQITNRLSEIDQFLKKEQSSQQEATKNRQELSTAVEARMNNIETSVREATDLQQLKIIMQEQVIAIRSHMSSYVQREETRQAQTETEINILGQKLTSMEAETEELRARYIEEHNQAMHDSLTGVYNRTAYDERISQEYERWKRYATPLSLIVVDIDYFKKINDTYGHKAGDKALTAIAKMMSTALRETDFLARYGGEEFVVLLPETALEAANIVAEKIRKFVEDADFHFRENRVEITVSCGVSAFTANDTPEIVFERADGYLYHAKQNGRNQCCSD